MLCEIGGHYGLGGFVAVWATMTISGFLAMMILSTIIFIPYYAKPTYEIWTRKCNPKFPSPALVRREIIQMTNGLIVATLLPAFSLFASTLGWSQGYCGDPHQIGVVGHIAQAVIIFGFSDLFEYVYHWVGHYSSTFWAIHRHHHAFYNPSPFAVIADEWPDQFMRTLPMAILPAIMPINVDLLFAIFATLFYGYGVYLHWGYESTWLSTHNPVFNTSYHHYMHHAISIIGKPIYTGFFFKIWDNMFGTCYQSPCQCVECRPKRSLKEWEETKKPDYSVLLSPKWWLETSIKVNE